MKNDMRMYNLLRYGILPGIGILIISLELTYRWTPVLELLLLASVPPLLGTLVLRRMLYEVSDMKQRLSHSIEYVEYLRPSYILALFTLVSMTIIACYMFSAITSIILSLGLIVVMLLLLLPVVRLMWQGTKNQAKLVEEEEDVAPMYYPRGYRENPPPRSSSTDELPQAQYEESIPPMMR